MKQKILSDKFNLSTKKQDFIGFGDERLEWHKEGTWIKVKGELTGRPNPARWCATSLDYNYVEYENNLYVIDTLLL